MQKVNIANLQENERRSPTGKFQRRAKDISIALGRERDSLDLRKRHPFDVALVTIPAGAALCPYHSHSCETEFYLIVSGRGNVRDASGVTEVGAGDAFFFRPGEAHQLSATTDDLSYYVIADNPIGDSCYYPDSRKWAVEREGGDAVIVQGSEADYFAGEE